MKVAEKPSEYLLVVDDDPNFLALMVETLSAAGYKVTTAMDGMHAVLQARTIRPRLILLDLHLPVWGSGIEAYQKIRKIPGCTTAPIVFFTGTDPLEARKKVPRDARTRLLAKPIDWVMLEQALHELLGENRPLSR